MRLALVSIIQNVKEDLTSGSSEMTSKLLLTLRTLMNTNRNITREDWKEFAFELKQARPGIATFFNVARLIEGIVNDGSITNWNDAIATKIDDTVQEEMDSGSQIADRFLGLMQGGTFLTLSYSSTIMTSLLHQKHENDVQVFVAESLPGGEGRITAKKLFKHNIPVKLVSDSMIGSVIDEVDCCIVGADAITPMGVMNKVGTRALAATCMTAGKTMYVLSSEFKIANLDKMNLMRSSKGGEGYPELSQMFEITPLDLIDKFVTNKRVIGSCSIEWK
jgi:translation initiation factor 2B subunit (eIF-2B alpha/beta/delta family)